MQTHMRKAKLGVGKAPSRPSAMMISLSSSRRPTIPQSWLTVRPGAVKRCGSS